MPPIVIAARCPWTDTGIDLVVGTRFRMHATGTWHDRQFPSSPVGIPPQNIVQRLFVPFLRFPNGRYMTLIGCIDQDADTAFAIGEAVEITASRSGRLWCYANDVRGAYGNNSGSVELFVDRVTT